MNLICRRKFPNIAQKYHLIPRTENILIDMTLPAGRKLITGQVIKEKIRSWIVYHRDDNGELNMEHLKIPNIRSFLSYYDILF